MAEPGPAPAAAAATAALAKGALRRLAQARQEPTPENYARAWAEEAGLPPPATAAAAARKDDAPDGPAWAGLIERLARHLDRGGREWTRARRKDSLQRVLEGSRSDAARLQQRLLSLLGAWESDKPADPAATGLHEAPMAASDIPDAAERTEATGAAETAEATDAAEGVDSADAARAGAPAHTADSADSADTDGAAAAPPEPWPPLVAALHGGVLAALPAAEPRAAALADRLGALARRIQAEGATPPLVAAVDAACTAAGRLFAHRHHLVDELHALCLALAGGLTDVAEDDSWARGQCEALSARLAATPGGPSVRGVRAASELLAATRQRQQQLRSERGAARDALKQLLSRMLTEVGDLGDSTGRFHAAVGRHAQAVARADSLESLAGVVQQMLDDSREVAAAVQHSRERLHDDHARAVQLEARVRELEAELRRLSDEVATDALTQVANRRGLGLAFANEVARAGRAGHEAEAGGAAEPPAPLAIALIDIDNFKKLNDTLGHAAGDVALQRLAAAVQARLRPEDHLARFGGEEFVVLLPATPVAEAQQALTRLQRALTASLFMHDGKEVFVTFSAGVTAWRPGEALEPALERADEALYEAKRTGKNRTCIA